MKQMPSRYHIPLLFVCIVIISLLLSASESKNSFQNHYAPIWKNETKQLKDKDEQLKSKDEIIRKKDEEIRLLTNQLLNK